MIYSFILFVLLIGISISILRKIELDFKSLILISIIISALGIMLLTFPILEYKNFIIRLLNSLYFAIKSIWMNQDVTILDKIKLNNAFNIIYYSIINILFILMPILTTGVIIAFISDLFSKLKLVRVQNKDLYIFSEINEKSELIAKKIREQGNPKEAIIFTNKKNNNTNIKSIKLEEKITDININNNSKITFYVLSNNEDDNITTGLKLINKYKNYKDVTIYVLNNNKNASIIFDSVDKGNITLEIINERERTIYNLLDTNPLFENTINNTISILIVGCGNVGYEFLRDATWCSVMPDFKYKANIIDINANAIKESIEVEAPEFLSNYNINFIEANYKSKELLEVIKKNPDINYIMVSMDSDDKNLDAAILLREKFQKIHNTMPSIHLWCSDNMKMEQINRMITQKNLEYKIHAFGSNKDIYYENMIIDSKFERLAMDVHVAYKDEKVDEDTKKKEYNDREYYKRSSRANALHIKYKFYSVLKEKYTNDMHKNQELFKSMYNDKIEKILIDCEHDRWNAYERSIGYTTISPKDVEKYYKIINNHENSLSKEHPALVDNKDLDKVSEGLKKYKNDIDLRDYDLKLLRGLINGKINL